MDNQLDIVADEFALIGVGAVLLLDHLKEDRIEERALLRRNFQNGVPPILKKGDCSRLSDHSPCFKNDSEKRHV